MFPFQHGNQNVREIFKAVDYSSNLFDVFKNFEVSEYLYAYGLCVNPEYRGRGIATEVLKARTPILKALGLTLTSTAFTGAGSQIAASRAGYTETFSITYEELQKLIPYYDFSASRARHFKTMVLKI